MAEEMGRELESAGCRMLLDFSREEATDSFADEKHIKAALWIGATSGTHWDFCSVTSSCPRSFLAC